MNIIEEYLSRQEEELLGKEPGKTIKYRVTGGDLKNGLKVEHKAFSSPEELANFKRQLEELRSIVYGNPYDLDGRHIDFTFTDEDL
jgi:hypothetical protein